VKERTQELYENNILLQKEINERKKYERDLKRETKRAQEADRLKSVFLANMSHEIRTPLNGIMGFSELLINPDLKQDKKERYIDIVKSNGQQLLKIIDDILDISMIESNQLKVNLVECKISRIYLDTLDFFANYKKTIGKNQIKLYGDKEKINDQLKFVTDPSRLQQVINNLMKNAFKFTSKGHVRFGYEVEKNNVVFFIEDTGIGIEKEKADAIFERFRQGEENMNRSYTGTGLGLSISKGIIEMLRGKIWVDTKYKDGAKFCFNLPLRYEPRKEEENNHFEPVRNETHNLKK
jgi:signal transduction histidine kinase